MKMKVVNSEGRWIRKKEEHEEVVERGWVTEECRHETQSKTCDNSSQWLY